MRGRTLRALRKITRTDSIIDHSIAKNHLWRVRSGFERTTSQGSPEKTAKHSIKSHNFETELISAMMAMPYNPAAQDLNNRMIEKESHKMDIVVVAIRKLLHIANGILKNKLPFDPNQSA